MTRKAPSPFLSHEVGEEGGHIMRRQAYRAALLHMLEDPARAPPDEACAYHSDGLLIG